MEDKKIKQQYLDFDEYIRQGEPGKKEKASLLVIPGISAMRWYVPTIVTLQRE